MKILNKKNLTQKIIITIIMVISFNFITPNFSQADFGGVLLGPIIDLLAGIGDSVMALLEVFMDGGSNDLLSSEGFLVKADEFAGNEKEYGMETDGKESETIEIDEKDLDKGWFNLGTYSVPIIKYSPEKIFSNQVPALDANFISPRQGIDTDNDGTIDQQYTQEQKEKSIAIQLREVISSWYNALMVLATVGFLGMLLFIGIKTLLSGISQKPQEKYAKLIINWFVGICLLFFLHYIMSFTTDLIETITTGINASTNVKVSVTDGTQQIFAFKTNLTGACRMQVQYNDLGKRMVYLIFYLALVIYTVIFTWEYMKRAITMGFLTLIAPLVVFTYPLDKMGDGKAQAYNMWLKEYIFNALLQPFHLILYTIFLSSGMSIAVNNPLYAILFLAFIRPAEKILRKFFKFDQASTADAAFGGAFGGAAAYNVVKDLVTKGAKGGGQAKVGSGADKNGIRQKKQLTDPKAPDGSLAPFAKHIPNNAEQANSDTGTGASISMDDEPELSTGARTATINNQDDDNQSQLNDGTTPEPEMFGLSAEGQRLARERETLTQLRNKATSDEERKRLEEEERRLRESDTRGILQWGRDAFMGSGAVQGAVKTATKFTRELADKPPIRAIASGIAKVAQGADNVRRAIPKPIRNTIKGAASVIKTAAPQGLKLAKGALGAGVGFVASTAAAITGASLDDLTKIVPAGTVLGGTLGPSVASNIVSGISSAKDTIANGYEAGIFGEEEAELRQQDRAFISNTENREFFENAMTKENGGLRPSRSELNHTMQVAAQYHRSGIEEAKEIDKCMKLENELQKEMTSPNSQMSEDEARKNAREQAITIGKMAKGIDAKDLRSEKKVRELQRSFERELLNGNPGMGQDAASKQATRIIENIKKIKKVY